VIKQVAILTLGLGVLAWAAVPAARAATLIQCAKGAPRGDTSAIAPLEDVRFPASDGVRLAGWHAVDPAARGTVVLVHGFKSSRSEMLEWATYLKAARSSLRGRSS
jgi:hypothetical protein